MCVIACGENGKVPDKAVFDACRERNSDGIGIAFLDSGRVMFRRGLKPGQAMELLEKIKELKATYILHFRYATQGAKNDPALTHPFPITSNKKLLFTLSGTADSVMAHNGTWPDWFEHPMARGRIFRQGSDSMFLAYLMGLGYKLKGSGPWNKVVTLDATGLRYFGYFPESDGIRYSNLSWKPVGYGGYFNGNGRYSHFSDQSWLKPQEPEKTAYRHVSVDLSDRCEGFVIRQNGRYACTRCDVIRDSAPMDWRCNATREEKAKGAEALLVSDSNGMVHQCYGDFCDICKQDVCQLEAPKLDQILPIAKGK